MEIPPARQEKSDPFKFEREVVFMNGSRNKRRLRLKSTIEGCIFLVILFVVPWAVPGLVEAIL